MDENVGNPLIDHLLARMLFNMTRHMRRGCLAIFELPDASDLDFCAEQLEAIEKDEELDPKIRRIHVPVTKGRLDQQKLRAFRTSSIEMDLLDIMLFHQAAMFEHTYVAAYHILLRADGEILIKKRRDGLSPNVFIPHEFLEHPDPCLIIDKIERAISGTL